MKKELLESVVNAESRQLDFNMFEPGTELILFGKVMDNAKGLEIVDIVDVTKKVKFIHKRKMVGDSLDRMNKQINTKNFVIFSVLTIGVVLSLNLYEKNKKKKKV